MSFPIISLDTYFIAGYTSLTQACSKLSMKFEFSFVQYFLLTLLLQQFFKYPKPVEIYLKSKINTLCIYGFWICEYSRFNCRHGRTKESSSIYLVLHCVWRLTQKQRYCTQLNVMNSKQPKSGRRKLQRECRVFLFYRFRDAFLIQVIYTFNVFSAQLRPML